MGHEGRAPMLKTWVGRVYNYRFARFSMSKQRKALALVSGGLDSMLAVKVIQQQGIHVEGVNFFTGFCVEGHTHAIRQKDRKKPKRNLQTLKKLLKLQKK